MATHRPAHGQDRGDGARGGGQRRVRQQDRRHRRPRRAGRVRRRAARASTRRTSTCCAWPPSWSSTPSCRSRPCATSSIGRFAAADPRRPRDRRQAPRRAAGLSVGVPDALVRRLLEVLDPDRRCTPTARARRAAASSLRRARAPRSGATDPSKSASASWPARRKAPWHFKLMLVLVVAYLGWRIVQMVMWVV